MEYIPIQTSDYSFDSLRKCVKDIKWPKNRKYHAKGISTDKFSGSFPVAQVDVTFKNEDNGSTRTMHWSLSGDDIRSVIEAKKAEDGGYSPLIPSSMFEDDVKKLIKCLCQVVYNHSNFSSYAKLTSMKLKYL